MRSNTALYIDLHSMPMPKHVFLSYCSAETEITQKVCTLLEAEGITCWMAPRDVKPGTVYSEAIVRAIR